MGWPEAFKLNANGTIEEGLSVFSRTGTIEGRTIGSRRRCISIGCPGWFIGVKWETGQMMYPCSEGWTWHPEERVVRISGGGDISARVVSPKPLGTPPLPRDRWPPRESLAGLGWRIHNMIGSNVADQLDQPTRAGARFRDAVHFAAVLHEQDVRKGTDVPYVSHVMAVASLVMENGGDEDQAIAALLHDALEDHPAEVTAELLEHRFGQTVANLVTGSSDGLPGGPREATTWRARKEGYLKHLRNVEPSVLLVSLADKVHNARSMVRDLSTTARPDEFWGRFNSASSEQLWYYGQLAEIFNERLPGPLAAELMQLVDAMRHAEVSDSSE
jgi:hypothetical protein